MAIWVFSQANTWTRIARSLILMRTPQLYDIYCKTPQTHLRIDRQRVGPAPRYGVLAVHLPPCGANMWLSSTAACTLPLLITSTIEAGYRKHVLKYASYLEIPRRYSMAEISHLSRGRSVQEAPRLRRDRVADLQELLHNPGSASPTPGLPYRSPGARSCRPLLRSFMSANAIMRCSLTLVRRRSL